MSSYATDLPPTLPPRIIRVAARLGDLPVELVEPVLKNLSLYRVLQLASTPSAAAPESRLRAILDNSPSWSSIFRVSNDRAGRIWASLSRLAWAWSRHEVQQVAFLHSSSLSLTSDELVREHGSDFGPPVVEELEAVLTRGFRQLLRVPGLHRDNVAGLTKALLGAICRFVPVDVLTLINANNLKALLGDAAPQGDMPDYVACTSSALHVSARTWDAAQFQAFLPYFLYAFNRLNQVKSEQLLRLAELYDQYPAWLKVPLGPQEPAPRGNPQHIGDALRDDARRIRTQTPLFRQVHRSPGVDWYRFRFPHPPLIPTDKALQLFTASKSSPPPPALLEHARRAVEGLWYMYEQDGKIGRQVRCVRDRRTSQLRHAAHARARCADAAPAAEMAWLESFLRCLNWGQHYIQREIPKLLLEPADYYQYIENGDPEAIAKQLVADFEISKNDSCLQTGFPSLTALYMPPFSSTRTRQVASRMWPEPVDDEIRKIYWEDAVRKLKRHLAKAPHVPEHEDANVLACDASAGQGGFDEATEEYVAAAASNKPGKGARVKCYICCLQVQKPHNVFSAMCEPCGEFNLAGSSASLPHHLRLEGRTALVTGARVNLGFHAVLRLLRCGASVIATTRYPRDAVTRYEQQPDAMNWIGRLRVVGADFRTANDAFALVRQTKSILREWGSGLDILINNAAQTLTDSVEMEEAAVARENRLKGTSMPVLAESIYEARVWRGASANNVLGEAGSAGSTRGKALEAEVSGNDRTSETLGLEDFPLAQKDVRNRDVVTDAVAIRPGPSSWVQSLSDIPYDDIITAHSINTFVPLILIRELMPLMDHRKGKDADPKQAHTGHIVNVSSREGIFEDRSKHSAKNGKHVHTNMSKAGLNMITETEASAAWEKYRVCMNTVDPGYMSAAPEYEDAHGGERPLSWEDGAGRVLWPIAMGEGSQGGQRQKNRIGTIWGRFLKHYGAVRVDTRLGRG
jgi:NAD(P)-dependent dehydrogenase (short-subunit alcohol dehydrogenase family)